MLFSIKNGLWPTLLLWVGFVGGALWLRPVLGLTWPLEWELGKVWLVLAGLLAVAASDGILNGLLSKWLGERYLSRYRALAFHFAPQGPAHFLAGGLLATGEELVFRGIVLEWVASVGGVPAGILIASLLFGLAHLIRDQRLAVFGLWATWEGFLLSMVYLLSGSLWVAIIVHGLHDALGFALFAYQRRTGWMLSSKIEKAR